MVREEDSVNYLLSTHHSQNQTQLDTLISGESENLSNLSLTNLSVENQTTVLLPTTVSIQVKLQNCNYNDDVIKNLSLVCYKNNELPQNWYEFYEPLNSSCTPPKDPCEIFYVRQLYKWTCPSLITLCCLTLIVNGIVIVSAKWCRKPMSPTLYFSISLALADAFAALVLGAGILINSYLPTIFDIKLNTACPSLTVEVGRMGAILVTIFHLLALAINHWIGILRPLHYAATMTRRTAWIIIIFSWICPFFTLIIYFSAGHGFMSKNCAKHEFLQEKSFRFVFDVFICVPLLLMFIVYLHIFFIVKDHHNHRRRFLNSQQLQRNVKAVWTTILILGTYIIGWLPATIWSILACNDCIFKLKLIPKEIRYPVSITMNFLLILKTLVNPIIYAARMSEIKLALKKMRYDILKMICGDCAASQPPPELERGRSRYCDRTKSVRMSSFGSSSSFKRGVSTNSNNSHYQQGQNKFQSSRNKSNNSSKNHIIITKPNGINNVNNSLEMTDL